jgi:DNA-binding transcriptional LysR family regulator
MATGYLRDLIQIYCSRHPDVAIQILERASTDNIEAVLKRQLVSMGLGISLTSEATIATPFPKVIFRPIAGDDELLHFNAVWLLHNDNPALRRFLALARRMASERRDAAARSEGAAGWPP